MLSRSASMFAGAAVRRCVAATAARSSASSVRAFSSWWGDVPMGPKDPILGVTEAFKADSHASKMNLGVGAYRDDSGKPVVLPSVAEAQRRVLDAGLDNEYAPIGGDPAFVKLALELAYGADSAPLRENRLVGLQALSGTGALRVMGAFINSWSTSAGGKKPTVYVPNPTWGNHFPIFQHAGLEVETYRYYDAEKKGLDFAGLIGDIAAAPAKSVFMFHACAHNPTGCDPSQEQWAEISAAVKKAGHFIIVDSAYQGFATGDVIGDAFALRKFVEDGHNIALSQSFAKNFGLYGHRVGTISMVCADAEEAGRVESQLKIVQRALVSSPPIQGSRIVQTILSDDALKQQWLGDVKTMADRIISMRTLLHNGLIAAGSQHNWDHITSQIGMFCYSGMSGEQVDALARDHHIYLTRNGRISMAGVTSGGIEQLAGAIHDVTK